MSKSDPILVKEANLEFNRWADFLFHRPYTTKVVAEFIDEIQDALEKIRDHHDRYPLEGYSDYRKFGPTRKHHFKVIYTVRDNVTWIVAITHPARRVRYWARRKLQP
jgi:ParE toxin of type II toxin-antitoxin system, parDE